MSEKKFLQILLWEHYNLITYLKQERKIVALPQNKQNSGLNKLQRKSQAKWLSICYLTVCLTNYTYLKCKT